MAFLYNYNKVVENGEMNNFHNNISSVHKVNLVKLDIGLCKMRVDVLALMCITPLEQFVIGQLMGDNGLLFCMILLLQEVIGEIL